MKTDMGFVKQQHDGLVWQTVPQLEANNAFFTRHGGVSGGIFSSLNLNMRSKDDPAAVRINYARIADALHLEKPRFVFSRQVHSTEIRIVTEDDLKAPYDPIDYEADGLLTDRPDVPLIIFTADCIPVLLSDPVAGCVGALHAGWRGTVADIVGRGVGLMVERMGSRPENIRAAIGPGIGVCCFETGDEVPQAVRLVLGDKAEEYIIPSNGRDHVDLKGVNQALLLRAGVLEKNITISPDCTMCLHDEYWSHRYTHGKRGVQGSLICRKGKDLF